MTTRPTPGALWERANGDRDEYRRLLLEHGHLIPRQEGDDGSLPCGWKPGTKREEGQR